jgi:hypothetical protein
MRVSAARRASAKGCIAGATIPAPTPIAALTRIATGNVVGLGEIQLDAIAGRVGEKELELARERHVSARVSDLRIGETPFHVGGVFA